MKSRQRIRRRRRNPDAVGLASTLAFVTVGGIGIYALYELISYLSSGSAKSDFSNWMCNNFNLACKPYVATNDAGQILKSPPQNVGVEGSYNYMDAQGNIHDVNGQTATDTVIGNINGNASSLPVVNFQIPTLFPGMSGLTRRRTRWA